MFSIGLHGVKNMNSEVPEHSTFVCIWVLKNWVFVFIKSIDHVLIGSVCECVHACVRACVRECMCVRN